MFSRLLIPALLVSGRQIDQVLGRWGYWVVFAVVLLQASGVPVPGTTALAAAAVYAGTTHRLAITGVIVAAAAGAIIGFAASFAIGRSGGWRLLTGYGHRIGLTEVRRHSAQAFFAAHGGAIVVLSRFVTGLRTWGGLIAGANLMRWRRFMAMNVIGGLAWSIANGVGYYEFGNVISSASAGVQIALVALAIAGFVATMLVLRSRARSFVRRDGDRAAGRVRVIREPPGNAAETQRQRILTRVGATPVWGSMSHEQHERRMRLRIGGEKREFLIVRSSARDYTLLEELSCARRAAQAEADLAYRRWTRAPTEERYVAYRAAQDRADAAQDQLAAWCRRCAA